MRSRVSRIRVLLGAALGLALPGWAGAQCLPAIKQRGVLLSANGLMGTKPIVWKDEQTGHYEGFEPALLDEITKRIGIPKWDYVVTEWTTMIPGLKAERWDVIFSSMSVTQERIQGAGIIYSTPYFRLYDQVIVPQASSIKGMDDLRGKTLAVPLGTLDANNAHLMVDEGKAGRVMEFNTFSEPFLALANGQVDAVLLDQATFVGTQEDKGGLRTVGEPIPYRPKPDWAKAEEGAPYFFGGTAMGMRRECTDLLDAVNKALADMDADGTRKAILTRYHVWAPLQEKMLK